MGQEKGGISIQRSLFLAFCEKRKLSDSSIKKAFEDLTLIENSMNQNGVQLDDCTESDLRVYLQELIRQNENSFDRFLTFARYFYVVNRVDLYRYFVAIIGGFGVIESISKRTALLTNPETADAIFCDIQVPPLGSPIEENPIFMEKLLNRMKEVLPEETFKRILAGNHHGIPYSSFESEKAKFQELHHDIDSFLSYRHQSQVAELEKYCKEGKIWYEQVITPEVVEYVRNHPEIQGGVREGKTILLTKIPFDPHRYISETDPDLKRFYACHCPFARYALLLNERKIIPEWCYCSAGFEKQLFDVLFEKELSVEVLETPFKGDTRCRFALHLD